jgi:hypothetical protein
VFWKLEKAASEIKVPIYHLHVDMLKANCQAFEILLLEMKLTTPENKEFGIYATNLPSRHQPLAKNN